jgi:hypothetical protein
MKIRITTKWRLLASLLTLFMSQMVNASELRLILTPVETVTIKPGAAVAFDAYLYNPGPAAAEAPSLELLSAIYTITDVNGARLGRAGISKETSTAPRTNHVLYPNSIERRRINLELPAEAGDLVKVHAEIGRKPLLRSNSVLLFCPPSGMKLR